ncbi:hypothetical protein D3OALGA1CA_5845 [Olavius algarvensis associated proteobacterium Delta 3]|nr:hypothetical protein D3OALGB2SA_1276 [Olavius algarvensis associated proteobacterium Delta 3]CAB5172583.1 hypothetical protein D3OALGA1CA_5845 [Olavius algarvensis associated proteobacterium Delta 3]
MNGLRKIKGIQGGRWCDILGSKKEIRNQLERKWQQEDNEITF